MFWFSEPGGFFVQIPKSIYSCFFLLADFMIIMVKDFIPFTPVKGQFLLNFAPCYVSLYLPAILY